MLPIAIAVTVVVTVVVTVDRRRHRRRKRDGTTVTVKGWGGTTAPRGQPTVLVLVSIKYGRAEGMSLS